MIHLLYHYFPSHSFLPRWRLAYSKVPIQSSFNYMFNSPNTFNRTTSNAKRTVPSDPTFQSNTFIQHPDKRGLSRANSSLLNPRNILKPPDHAFLRLFHTRRS